MERLSNVFLFSAFLLKKREMGNPAVLELIHSTAAKNVRSIAQHNLDWRLVKRAKYGFGVAFSGNADYSDNHSNCDGGMIVNVP